MLDAHQKYGLLPWRRLFQPSIALARDGFPVTAVMQSRLDSESKHLLARKSFLEVFAPNGSLLRQGDVIRRERFAKTLEVLAEDPESFYSV